MIVEITRKAPFVAVSLCVLFLCAWIIFIGLSNPATDRRIANVALSSSDRWLAGGTVPGRITLLDQTLRDAPKQIAFPHGVLNDLQFSPDEHVLAIASEDLGMSTPTESAAPRLLRSDHENYGSARFRRDGESLLVITGASRIETTDVNTEGLRIGTTSMRLISSVGSAECSSCRARQGTTQT